MPTASRIKRRWISAPSSAVSMPVSAESFAVSGITSMARIAPTTASFAMFFRSSTAARSEKRRFRPASGEMRERSKLIFSVANTRPVWITEPATAAATSSKVGSTSDTAISARSARIASQRMPSPLKRLTGSRKRVSVTRMRAVRPGASSSTSAAPVASMKRLLISRDCTTWPCWRARESLRADGCSVFWLSSASAIDLAAGERRELLREALEEPFHAGRQHEGKRQEAAVDLQRLRHEENLQLRHEARDEADRDEEERAQQHERRRHLHAEAKGSGD